MKRIYIPLLAIGFFLFTAVSFFVSVKSVSAMKGGMSFMQVAAACQPGDGALPSAIFVPWYAYLGSETVNGKCVPQLGDDYVATASKIGLAIIDTLTRIAAVLALAYVLYGAVIYVTSQGDRGAPGRPGPVIIAKETITNAIIGLVIALLAIGIVQFIGNLVRG